MELFEDIIISEDLASIEFAFLEKQNKGQKNHKQKSNGKNQKFALLEKLMKVENELNLKEKFMNNYAE